MGLTTTSVWVTSATRFRGALAGGEPILTLDSGTYATDVSIFLGCGSGGRDTASIYAQLDAFRAALAEAEAAWEATLPPDQRRPDPADAPAEPLTPDQAAELVTALLGPDDGPDDPDDEPTDEPVAGEVWTPAR